MTGLSDMPARLKTEIWVKALLRRFNSATSTAMLLQRGDSKAGMVFIVLTDPENRWAILYERQGQWQRHSFDLSDEKEGTDSSPTRQVETYLERQKHYDPDLWIVEITLEDCRTPIEKTLESRHLFPQEEA